MKILLSAVTILLGCSTAGSRPAASPPAQARLAKPWQEVALRSSQAAEFVQDLTDTAGPRLAGTAEDKMGRDWALSAMRRVGLSDVREQPVRIKRWRRGQETGEVVAPVSQKAFTYRIGWKYRNNVTARGGSR